METWKTNKINKFQVVEISTGFFPEREQPVGKETFIFSVFYPPAYPWSFRQTCTRLRGQSLFQSFHCLAQLIVFLHHAFNFADGVDDGRMIFTTEALADFRVG